MKTLLLLLTLSLQVFALEYNSLTLRAQADIFPKIILLDKAIQEKASNDNILTLAIIHSTDEKDDALNFKNMIEKKFNAKLGSYIFQIVLHNSDESQLRDASSYYFLSLKGSNKQEILKKAMSTNKICFSYDSKDFTNQSLISLILKEKTYIYLNKSALTHYGIKFVPIFYKIVKAK
ncbi:hypothetical protein GJV85_09405 [Sulfurimonas aquatica]|uniref:DUF4154 domain-containing protein n=1 Tax=Sulfurimonas aquatica TaxID=2672570 RepID=A0A975B169_9BACT|nr:hypothetical protein [Sulfurimonas aquatica]QSZ42314.1 hypothetical protein GJV85_09405 [Sulfurimonas aquatica]